MKSIQTAYLISMPDTGIDPQVFKFQVKTASGNFNLSFRWDVNQTQWIVYATLPDLTIRQVGWWPGSVSWTAWVDFGFYIQTTLETIGQNDLSKVSPYILVWGK